MNELQIPPNNPSKTLFRIILWLLPTGFAVLSAIGSRYLPGGVILDDRSSLTLWLILNILFTAGAGWFNAHLSNRVKPEQDGALFRTFVFVIAQMFLVPLLLMTLLFAVCLFNPIKF